MLHIAISCLIYSMHDISSTEYEQIRFHEGKFKHTKIGAILVLFPPPPPKKKSICDQDHDLLQR